MKAAEYPQKRCREAVFNQVGMAYPCELPMLHTGPCGSFSVKESTDRRDAWEQANPDLLHQSVDGGDIIIDTPGATR